MAGRPRQPAGPFGHQVTDGGPLPGAAAVIAQTANWTSLPSVDGCRARAASPARRASPAGYCRVVGRPMPAPDRPRWRAQHERLRDLIGDAIGQAGPATGDRDGQAGRRRLAQQRVTASGWRRRRSRRSCGEVLPAVDQQQQGGTSSCRPSAARSARRRATSSLSRATRRAIVSGSSRVSAAPQCGRPASRARPPPAQSIT